MHFGGPVLNIWFLLAICGAGQAFLQADDSQASGPAKIASALYLPHLLCVLTLTQSHAKQQTFSCHLLPTIPAEAPPLSRKGLEHSLQAVEVGGEQGSAAATLSAGGARALLGGELPRA